MPSFKIILVKFPVNNLGRTMLLHPCGPVALIVPHNPFINIIANANIQTIIGTLSYIKIPTAHKMIASRFAPLTRDIRLTIITHLVEDHERVSANRDESNGGEGGIYPSVYIL